ncbi:unnamed protein product [Menidia menidia]|uniref:(Atlantic silverside) hypothetical protein n=1 Tax=Menidia menidia TaxID=238744 RepID=A0A8S4BYZ5_9TELE|nr:unnamed protein product [Menidia menidia]
MATLGHSEKCLDLTTYWNKYTHKCVPCQLQPGHEVTPNCGRDDDNGVHELPASPCKQHTFNDGSRPYCQPCSSCQPNSYKVENCTSTRDTLCNRRETTTAPSTNETHQEATSAQPGMSHVSATVWAVPLVIFVIALLALTALFIVRRKRAQRKTMFYIRRSSYTNEGFCTSFTASNNDLEDILNLDILSAPLQAVLDDLDVLEELIILLDPETVGIKNTKNLASQCSFSAAWITYTYSMKDSKSPLKVVLEGVTSKHPDWTVGHLAKLLRQIERNDAVAVLAKLKPKGMC